MHVVEIIVGVALALGGILAQNVTLRSAIRRHGGVRYSRDWRLMLPAQIVTLVGIAIAAIGWSGLRH
jgi:hypothetical protein